MYGFFIKTMKSLMKAVKFGLLNNNLSAIWVECMRKLTDHVYMLS